MQPTITFKHAWELYFKPELEAQGRKCDWPPPDDLQAAQIVWDWKRGPRVLFNQDVEPLRVRVRVPRPMEKGEVFQFTPEDVVETHLESGFAHCTALRVGEGWWLSFNLEGNWLNYPVIAWELADFILPPQARRDLCERLGEDYGRVATSALALVLGKTGTLAGSEWALRREMDREAYGEGIHSRRARHEFLPLEEVELEMELVEPDFALSSILRIILEELLEELSELPGYDEAWMEIEGFTQEEIAAQKGVDQSTVQRRIQQFYAVAQVGNGIGNGIPLSDA